MLNDFFSSCFIRIFVLFPKESMSLCVGPLFLCFKKKLKKKKRDRNEKNDFAFNLFFLDDRGKCEIGLDSWIFNLNKEPLCRIVNLKARATKTKKHKL